MIEAAPSAGNLLTNGALLPALWPHTRTPEQPLLCPLERSTFSASRWYIRYAAPEGGAITQRRSQEVLPSTSAMASVELRPAEDAVTQTVFFGQRIEAAEAFRYRRELVFSAWLFLEGSGEAVVEMHAAAPREADIFSDQIAKRRIQSATIARGGWALVEFLLDAREFATTGLAVELAFAPELFSSAIRIAQLSLIPRNQPPGAARSAALEALLAERFFQRHDSSRINSLGRALVVNAHELHFHFAFPEMRAFPACKLPHSEEGLRVFHLEGIPQTGFRYDVTYRSRSSVIIRATKKNHGLTDGFLSFVGDSAAILLDAEL